MRSLKLKTLAASSIFLIASSATIAQTCNVVPFTWRWWSNLADADDQTSGPLGTGPSSPGTYSYWINFSAPVYTDTDIDLGLGPQGQGEVVFINENWGFVSEIAYSRTWSGGVPCQVMTGPYNPSNANSLCGATSVTATRGRIVYNDYWLSRPNWVAGNMLQLVTLHEVGHNFAMNHVPQHCTSFMRGQIPFNSENELQDWEVTWINSNY